MKMKQGCVSPVMQRKRPDDWLVLDEQQQFRGYRCRFSNRGCPFVSLVNAEIFGSKERKRAYRNLWKHEKRCRPLPPSPTAIDEETFQSPPTALEKDLLQLQLKLEVFFDQFRYHSNVLQCRLDRTRSLVQHQQ
jgi:hypothetical protein